MPREVWIIGIVVLTFGLVATVTASALAKKGAEKAAASEFNAYRDTIKNQIARRLDDYARVLRSCAAFFEASDRVTREKWRIFMQAQQVQILLPGIQGTGFSLLVPRKELAGHIRDVRREGFPEYTLRPASDREVYSSIIYLEPFSGRNLRAFGYDMFTESVRRQAMEQARDTGTIALSGKVVLVQETDVAKQTGTLMYFPIFRKGMPTMTVAQRRAALYGWVYSPYRMGDLVRGILGEDVFGSKILPRLEIFDSLPASPINLLVDSTQEGLRYDPLSTQQDTLEAYGQRWILRFTKVSDGRFAADYRLVWAMGMGGTLLTLALCSYLIMARRRLLAVQAAQQVAENAARTKSTFMDIAAHELRTPVTAFSLLLQLAQIQLEKGHPVDLSVLVRLRAQAARLAHLVVDLLEVSRLERGVLKLKVKPTDLGSLVAECVDAFKLTAPTRVLTFSKPDHPLEAKIDPIRIFQVLSNLIDNALKYTEEGTPIEVMIETRADRVRVSVNDLGPGISEQQQAELFKPFQRGTTGREERSGGLGLGLFISRSIIELHGGTIGVTSKVGTGATFYFELQQSNMDAL